MKKIILKLIGLGINTLCFLLPKKGGKVSLNLFCSPLRIPLTDKQLSFLNSGEKIGLQSNGEQIAVYKWGSGHKKVVFMHGWQSHSFRWKKYIEKFDFNLYTLYAIDAPAHGQSTGKLFSVPLYSDAVEKLFDSIGEVHTVVAHSIGCFAALFSFHRNQAYTPQRLILMAPPENALEFFDFYQKSLSLSHRSIDLTKQSFKEEFGQDPDFFSASSFASSLQIRGLIIHDALDNETPLSNAEAISAAWSKAKLHITKGLGHNLKSEDIISETLQFIDLVEQV